MSFGLLRNDLFYLNRIRPLRKAIATDTDTKLDNQHTSNLLQTTLYPEDVKRNRTCKIRVKLHTYVHGYLAPDEREAASLVVFSVSLNCSKRGRYFSRFKRDVEFFEIHAIGSTSEKYSESKQAIGHAVLRHAPHWADSKERTTDVEKGKTRNAEVNLNIGAKGAKTGVNFGEKKGTTETYQHKYLETCRSNTRCQPDSDIPVAVEWILRENNQPNAKDDAGLIPEVLFAVLLQRRDKEKFGVRLSLKADTGKRYLYGIF
jgi:hypothetical protein